MDVNIVKEIDIYYTNRYNILTREFMEEDFENEMIELTPYEQASFWWVTRLRCKVKEILEDGYSYGSTSRVTEEFYDIFGFYTEDDWRNIYLKLAPMIEEDVKRLPKGTNWFTQDEALKGHNKLNKELSSIVGRKVPDIRLSNNTSKDSILYVSQYRTCYWYKSYQRERSIDRKYPKKYNYVLTGNKDELDFYNVIKATLLLLLDDFTYSCTVDKVCNAFCKAYMEYYNIIELDSGTHNKEFEEYLRNEFMYVLWWEYKIIDRYKALFIVLSKDDIDTNGLEEYQDAAEYVANYIRNECKEMQKKKRDL